MLPAWEDRHALFPPRTGGNDLPGFFQGIQTAIYSLQTWLIYEVLTQNDCIEMIRVHEKREQHRLMLQTMSKAILQKH